ncbi:MAG: DUF4380 domain-containing protein [Tannerella sp.]|jgi:hypothetical protein|nr:DUF4380 domain-containing protein [Tannerella sp.]
MMTVATSGYCPDVYDRQKDNFTLSYAGLSVTVSRNGGKIISFKRSGKEMLTQRDIHPSYYGGTLWISPQAANWPPSAEIDREPYETHADGDMLSMTSRPDKKTGLMVRKTFRLSTADTSLLLQYTIINTSPDTVRLSPWDVVRTPPGISFFPAGEEAGVNNLGIDGSYVKNGTVWCPTDSLLPEKGLKLFHTAANGWLAHYANGLLLIKCFPDITPGEMPPGQGEVEIYIAPQGAYAELENHGRYVTLAPGDSTLYSQEWFLPDIGTGKQEEIYDIVKNRITRGVSPRGNPVFQ